MSWVCASVLVAGAQGFVMRQGRDVTVYLEETGEPVSRTALEMLQGDVRRVLDARLVEVANPERAKVVATLDRTLPREGFRLRERRGRLLIEGADAHGLAYGLMEVSRRLGVSPWEWWADCLPVPLPRGGRIRLASALPPSGIEESPAVAFRGIFINDEDWGILPWSGGVIGSETNERIFQLMLRLRANYYWPSMHEVSKPFFTIEGNREMAHRYGIYVGGSHCEPMATSPATEWRLRGVGDYNYVTNREAVLKFWRDRVEEVKGQDIVYTLGMRGVHDGSMQGVKTREDKLKYLQQVIDDQRKMLATQVDADVTKIPQVFVPYKEVLDIYHAGLKVPDDVTLMWTDDNYGYIRHFPDEQERLRRGGNGLYYHVSYWGRPHDYLWLGTFSPELMRHQLSEAYRRGIRQMWILNVGDIKPAEYLVEDFLNMAWDGKKCKMCNVKCEMCDGKCTRCAMRCFYEREFGAALADTLTAVMADHYRLAFDRKPEHLGGTRTEEADKAYWNRFRPVDGWSKEDVEQRVADYQRLSDAVEALETQVPRGRKDAYFQLVKYPVQAAAQMNFKFLSPERSAEAYDSIVALTHIYNNNPRWKGIMDMAPRKLAVFGKVTEPLVYPDARPVRKVFDADTWLSVRLGEEKTFTFVPDSSVLSSSQGETVGVFDIRLLPTHPVSGDRLTFSVSVDGGEPQTFDYQTYDRSEEWKQNVLRNYAQRLATLPLTEGKEHTLTFKALSEGVYLRSIRLRKVKVKNEK